jgi:hypothetical protein
MRKTRNVHGILLLLSAVVLLFGGFRPAAAIPAFARKYETSCQTCHTIFPKLNPFGEAFRLNGYRLPAETEDQIKQKQVSLGADAYKKIWPEMVWPGEIAGSVPLALNVKMASLYSSSLDDTGHAIIHNDFQFPQEVNIFGAGTLGEHFSYFAELTYAERPDGGSDTEIEHAQFHINSPFGPEHAFNFKIGKFAPDLEDGFQEMWLMTDNGVDTMFTYNPVGFAGGNSLAEDGGGISLPAGVKGIEMYGVVAHRFFYTAGITNGIGPSADGTTVDGNTRKDFYARFDYKFGGMGLDGDTTGVTMPPENWRESSLRVGLLGYWGDGSDINFAVTNPDPEGPALTMQDRKYTRYGVYASWLWRDLNLFGVALKGKDELRLQDETFAPINTTNRTYDTWFLQADYVFAPPFQASLRYENLNFADEATPNLRLFNANFSTLIRANIKAMLEYRRDLDQSQNYQIAAVLRFAY